MNEELRCPYCQAKLGQVNKHGQVVARISKNGHGKMKEALYLKNEDIKLRCCDRVTLYLYDGYTVSVTPVTGFVE